MREERGERDTSSWVTPKDPVVGGQLNISVTPRIYWCFTIHWILAAVGRLISTTAGGYELPLGERGSLLPN